MTPEILLSTRLREDITWRIRELSEIVRLCSDPRPLRREAALRASVPVLYAHWEGYFVVAVNAYLSFVASKRLKLSVLRNEFWLLTMRKRVRLQQLSSDRKLNDFLLEIRNDSDRAFKTGDYERIHAASNLKSDILEYCCRIVGLDYSAFAEYADFIDKELIDKRNHIAHGSSLRFDAKSVGEYRDKVVELMRITQTAIENCVISCSFRKAS
jgi:hypothetical protein